MAKRAFFFLFCLLIPAIGVVAEENLVKNGSFEELSGALPIMWSTDAWDTSANATKFYIEDTGAFTGKSCAVIENVKANDARYIQHVSVKPNAVYKLSCQIKASGVGGNALGGNISVLNAGMETSQDFKETKGEWKYVEYYGKTGPEQTELPVVIRLGGYSSVNTGKVAFDDFRMVEVSSVPAGVPVARFYIEKDRTAFQFLSLDKTAGAIIPLLFYSLLFVGLLALLSVFVLRKGSDSVQLTEKTDISYVNLGLLILACGAFVLRIYIAYSQPGYIPDIIAFKEGLKGASDKAFPFGPAYLLILSILGLFRQALAIDVNSADFLVLLKLPSILADLTAAGLMYFFFKKKIAPLAAAALSLLYFFNPAIIFNSSAFGQIDSFLALFVFLTVFFIYDQRPVLAAGFFSFAGLIKPLYFVILAPPLVFALADLLHKKEYKKTMASAASALGVLLVFFLIYAGDGAFLRLLSSTSRFYITDNAFNLYALFGLNGQSHSLSFILPYYVWGSIFLIITLASAVFFAYWFKYREEKNTINQSWPFVITIFILAGLFLFATGIDERFIIPALILLLAVYAHTQDRRLLWLFAGFSVVSFFNQGLVLEVMQKNGLALVPNEDIFMKLLAIAHIGLFAYMLTTGIAIYKKRVLIALGARLFVSKSMATKAELTEGFPVQSISSDNLLQGQDDERGGKLKWSRLDLILAGALTLIYCVIALYNLGTLKSPQTYWKPSNRGESFYIDFGQTYSLGRVNYFFGLGQGTFNLEYSNDAQNWEQLQQMTQRTQFDMMEWRFMLNYNNARYVRITCESPGVMLKEIGFFKRDSEELIPIQEIVHLNVSSLQGNGQPAFVFDEPDTVAFRPSYLNGMHFDEVYHARTGYEHSLLLYPSETTHPPLGKLIISLGILIFGMSPFGWRIMGTLVGIAMVPIFYAFGKRVFRKTEYAFMTAFLMAFDFMHFTQTRIATIDVYGVFFIILMYYFMYKYYHMNFFRDKLGKTLTPLFLSGLFAGLGIASKWTALWGALGMAILFFSSLFSRYLEYRLARWKLTGKQGILIRLYLWLKRTGRQLRSACVNFSISLVEIKLNRVLVFFPFLLSGFLFLILYKTLETNLKVGIPLLSIATIISLFLALVYLRKTNEERLLALKARQTAYAQGEPEEKENRKENEYKVKVFFPHMWKTLGWCVLVFILLPVFIMELAYVPIMLAKNSYMTPLGVFQDQIHMFNYHANITQTHPFMSQWWEWPLLIKPIWYYSGQSYLPPDHVSSIVAFGNPAIWWLGILTIPAALIISLIKKHKWMFIIIIIAASQYLPWIVIPRKVVFIYHFFPTVPFLMLSTVYCLKFLTDRIPWFKYVNYFYLGLVLLLFVAFYPVISGFVIDKAFVANFLRWFDTWFFYS